MTSTFTFTCRQTLTIALTAFFFMTAARLHGQGTASLPLLSAPVPLTVQFQRHDARAASAGIARAEGMQSELPSVDPNGLDTRIFRSVNNAQNNFKTSLFHITDNSVAVLVVGVPLGCIIYGIAADNRDVLNTGVLISGSEVFTYGLNYVLKSAIKRSRPYAELASVNVHDIESADQYSFPSGHASGAFALATMLSLRYPKPAIYIPAFIWAGMVGYGRVYNGVHYPSDVLGGAVLGAGSSVLTYALRTTIIDVFDRVTGSKPDAESSLLIMPVEGGAAAYLSVHF